MKNVVGNWDQGENVENGEEDDRTCRTYSNARREDIEIRDILQELHKDVRHRTFHSSFSFMT